MAKAKKAKVETAIEAYTHEAEDVKRSVLPSGEYSGIEAERIIGKPKVVKVEARAGAADLREEMAVRDVDLDPQLVWRGKKPYEGVETLAPYIYQQEKILPRALIEDLKRETAARKDAVGSAAGEVEQDDLLGWGDAYDANATPAFYHHEQNWSNRMILGDSLKVMASLAENERLRGKVQTIYFDPPYGIKFNSNWQPSTASTDVKDGKMEDITREPEMVKAFRDTWSDGIHSYLGYLRERLMLARELLTESGSVFVQISDENVHKIRCVLDEVFGEGNFVSMIAVRKTSSTDAEYLDGIFDYIIWYGKTKEHLKYRAQYEMRPLEFDNLGQFNKVLLPDGTEARVNDFDKSNYSSPSKIGRVFRVGETSSSGNGGNKVIPYLFHGKKFLPSTNRHWSTNEKGMERLDRAARLVQLRTTLGYVRYYDDFPVVNINNIWTGSGAVSGGKKIYIVQTNTSVIQRCLLMTTDPGDLVLDPTCGSGTTAYVAEQWGRRWITIDTSRVSLAIARRRLMTARFPYYYLLDSEEGLKKEMEVSGKVKVLIGKVYNHRLSQGFVYKRVPHVTLKAIANNSEIDAIWAKYEKDSLEIREGAAAGGKVPEEWEMPFEEGSEFQKMKARRQAEIDASIAKTAEVENLYDQPYEDKKRVRVTGPFTVESLAPVRSLIERADGELEDPAMKLGNGVTYGNGANYVTRMIQALRRNGVKQSKKKDRIEFTKVEAFGDSSGLIAAEAVGEVSEKTGKVVRYAIAFGPEFGSVRRDEVMKAGKRAMELGFDVLIYCAFSFDAYVGEGTEEQMGDLKILHARMNADLHMVEDLKDTGHGNPFIIFGAPDIELKEVEGREGMYTVTIRGVDVYDPKEGEVRSDDAKDIDCWMVDTDYCGFAFFARQIYFPDNEKVYDGLKKVLTKEVDREAWASVARTTSRAFARPKSGQIAVKVINHFGDEVMKIFPVPPKGE